MLTVLFADWEEGYNFTFFIVTGCGLSWTFLRECFELVPSVVLVYHFYISSSLARFVAARSAKNMMQFFFSGS
jgi:hypothetical protein